MEVLKNVQSKKKCKQCGRPSRKHTALSFTAKGSKKPKQDPPCEKSDSLGNLKFTVVDQLTSSDKQARKCEIFNEQLNTTDGEWLDDQTNFLL